MKNIGHDPSAMTPAQQENMITKINLVMSMAGKDPATMLTVLSYALIRATYQCEVTFASVVAALGQMYDAAGGNERVDRGEEE